MFELVDAGGVAWPQGFRKRVSRHMV